MVSDPVFRVDLDVLELLAGRLSGLATRLSADDDLLRPSAEMLGAPAVVEAFEHLASRWQAAGAGLTADVGVAVRHLSAAVDHYAALDASLAEQALAEQDAQAVRRGTGGAS